jgi:hypothetical protein
MLVGGTNGHTYFNDIWLLDPSSGNWEVITPAQGQTSYTPRAFGALFTSTNTSQAWVFGGHNNGNGFHNNTLADLFIIDFTNPTPSPIAFTCPQPPPIPQAICTTNGWIVLVSVSTTSITISGNVVINGSVQVSEEITFHDLNSHLASNGCITIGGSVVVELSEEEVQQLLDSSSNNRRTLASQAEGCNSISDKTPLILKQTSQSKSCKKLKIRRDYSQPATQFGVLFEIDKSRCNIWWIVLVSVVCVALMGVIIGAIVYQIHRNRMFKSSKLDRKSKNQ